MTDIFFSIGLIIVIATIGAYLAKLMKQPLIPAYILSGLLIGPGLKLITNTATISTLSEMGIAFLLFIVGLEMDFSKLRNVARVSIWGGLGQMIILFNFGFLTAVYLGFRRMEAIYFGLILTFSSTAVVLKLLSDKNEIDTLHARLVIGFLLIEDIVVVFAMSILTSLNNVSAWGILISLGNAALVILGGVLASKYIFPKIFKFAAESQELLFLLSMSILFLFAMLFTYLGFSVVIGAFVAGIILGNLPYHLEIMSRAKSLKDFFATIFFVSLGLELSLSAVRRFVWPIVIFFLFIVIVKPLITMTMASLFGYTKKPSFLAAISLTQISEFSLIIVAQGLVLGHISKDVFSMTIFLMMGTVTATSYFVKYEDKLYSIFDKRFKFFENVAHRELENIPKKFKPDYILVGYNRIGYSIIKSLHSKKKKVLVVDFNPEVVRALLKKRNIRTLYGDIGDVDIIDRIGVDSAKMVISTDPELHDNMLLLRRTKAKNKNAKVVVTASHVEEAIKLYNAGADYVILPHYLGGEHMRGLIDGFEDDLNVLVKTKKDHLKELIQRRHAEHPVLKKPKV